MIVMISDDSRFDVGPALKEAVLKNDVPLHYISADRLDVRPCTACMSCSGKTYGRCIVQDDMQHVLPYIARCRALVLVSPVVFGGTGYHIKKIMDRMLAVGDPRYRVSDGELVKAMHGKGWSYFMVGLGDDLDLAEEDAFLSLHAENKHIMSADGKGFLLPERPDKSMLTSVVKEIIHA